MRRTSSYKSSIRLFNPNEGWVGPKILAIFSGVIVKKVKIRKLIFKQCLPHYKTGDLNQHSLPKKSIFSYYASKILSKKSRSNLDLPTPPPQTDVSLPIVMAPPLPPPGPPGGSLMHTCTIQHVHHDPAGLREGGSCHMEKGEYKRHNISSLLTDLSADLESMYRMKTKNYR
jgi:hypothetical protein